VVIGLGPRYRVEDNFFKGKKKPNRF